MEPTAIPGPAKAKEKEREQSTAGPVNTMQTNSDIDMLGTPARQGDEGSDAAEEEEDGLFAGGDDEDEEEEDSGPEDDAMEEVQTSTNESGSGVKRKLVEEEDYD